jgi:hypothetical protein
MSHDPHGHVGIRAGGLPGAGYAMDLGQTLAVPAGGGVGFEGDGFIGALSDYGAAGFFSSSSLRLIPVEAEDRPADLGAP